MSSTSHNARLSFDPSVLPIAQLESLKFKANQMIESIQLLQRTIEVGGQNAMPAWPDILSKYNILLSQSHSLSMSLLGPGHGATSSQTPGNQFERLALHPSVAMTDQQLDNELIPLLRNQQTTDVLKIENDTVRRLSEHMESKGSIGILSQNGNAGGTALGRRPEYEDVLRECEQIRAEHDERIDRAVRAVSMLREKYDWKARVAVDQEEPEELEWGTRLDAEPLGQVLTNRAGARGHGDGESEDTPNGRQSNDSDEEEELEEVLGNGDDQTPDTTPGAGALSGMAEK